MSTHTGTIYKYIYIDINIKGIAQLDGVSGVTCNHLSVAASLLAFFPQKM